MDFYKKIVTVFLLFCTISTSGQDDSVKHKTTRDLPYRVGVGQTEFMKESCKLDLYCPENTEDFVTVIWFHSGGLSQGEKYIPAELMNQGIAIAAINYRLSPKAKCPDYIDDASVAIKWVFNHISEYCGTPDKIVVAGASAGGYLTLMTVLDKHWLATLGIDADKIAMAISLSGQTIVHATIRKELGLTDKQPLVNIYAPLYHVRPDSPPLYLITGDRNLKLNGHYEENVYLWRMMKVAGHSDCDLFELGDFFNHSYPWIARVHIGHTGKLTTINEF